MSTRLTRRDLADALNAATENAKDQEQRNSTTTNKVLELIKTVGLHTQNLNGNMDTEVEDPLPRIYDTDLANAEAPAVIEMLQGWVEQMVANVIGLREELIAESAYDAAADRAMANFRTFQARLTAKKNTTTRNVRGVLTPDKLSTPLPVTPPHSDVGISSLTKPQAVEAKYSAQLDTKSAKEKPAPKSPTMPKSKK